MIGGYLVIGGYLAIDEYLMKEAAQNYDGTHAIESDTVSDLWFYKKISTLKSAH